MNSLKSLLPTAFPSSSAASISYGTSDLRNYCGHLFQLPKYAVLLTYHSDTV